MVPFELGREYFARMLDAIEQARVSVDVEMYLWDNDALGRRFIEALRRAAQRGLRVRVLADGYGARAVVGRPLSVVSAAGGDVRVFNPLRFPRWRRLVHRTHKKLLTLDGRLAFCGGAGFSTHFSSGTRWEPAWHDRMFEISGPLVRQLETAFLADFDRWNPDAGPGEHTLPTGPPPADAGNATGRVLRGWPDGKDFPRALIDEVRTARRRVWLGTPYFLPPRRLRGALYGALERGVEVCLVVPSLAGAHWVLWYASRRYYGRLLKRGARIFEFGPRFYHAKVAVKDGDTAFVGSSNLDSWSWRRNAELDIAFTDPDSVETLAACFEQDVLRAREVTLSEHRSRGIWARLTEKAVGILDEWL